MALAAAAMTPAAGNGSGAQPGLFLRSTMRVSSLEMLLVGVLWWLSPPTARLP